MAFCIVALASILLPACTQTPAEPPSPVADPTPTAALAGTQALPLATVEPLPVEALPLAPMELEPAFPRIGIDRMVLLTHAGDDSGRLFVVLQPGRIVVFENDPAVESLQVFLDIRDRVSDAGNEEGLLGLAFDPAYVENGYFYVYYSAARPRRSVLSRFSVSPGDPDQADSGSELVFMEVRQPYSNHNGGHLLFGPDGMLYVGLGDGGAAGDPRNNGQDTSTLLGSILRIDVSRLDALGAYAVPEDNPFAGGGTARGEIWAYGLRNPWRFSFDLETGDLWAADVGQFLYEEIDVIRPGLNYGWNVMEGSHCFRQRDCDTQGLVLPVAEYGREGGCSVTGGHVYRGRRIPALYGAYLYGDFCSGKIWALRYDGEAVTEHMEIADTGLSISSFGEDPSGEVYALTFEGVIYRFAAHSRSSTHIRS